ncbi:MAG: 16S rRNA (guanine(527)-N(7))-methyltransferase RsmG [Pseudomonadota bacterium]
MNKREKGLLLEGARGLGILLSPVQLHLIGIYLDELWQWNEKVNLTGLSSRERIISELLVDSLLPSPFLPQEGRLLDVGSGAGFPGIPLKIHRPGLEVHLMEANSRKASFLKHVIRITKLPEIEVIRGRIERDSRYLHPHGYHVVTARALSPLPQCISWCAPLLCPEGLMVSFQGSRFEEAIKDSSAVIKAHGLLLYKSIAYNLHGKDTGRHLLIFKRQE